MLLKILAILISSIKINSNLVIENMALRQQLAVFKNKRKRPVITDKDRLFWIWLSCVWANWKDALIIVEPETVVRWHRQGFKKYWRWKSKRKRPGRPRIDREIRELIRRMATENPTWRAPRIHGELLKLGLDVSERTVSRYLPKRNPDPDKVQSWMTFLKNHRSDIAAIDFFTVPTFSFKLLYVFFIIEHERRRILHINVTFHPTADWVIQQLRDAFTPENMTKYLIFDRDSIFSKSVVKTIKSFGIKAVRTSYRSPWQNGICEKQISNFRREIMNHVVPLSERHVRRLLRDYQKYFEQDRSHYALDKETPGKRETMNKPTETAEVIALPRLGGLHHRYEWRDAG